MVENVEELILYTDLVHSSKCSRTNDAAFAQFRFLDQSQLGQVWFGFCGGHRLWGAKTEEKTALKTTETSTMKIRREYTVTRIQTLAGVRCFGTQKWTCKQLNMKIWHARKNRQIIHQKMSVWLSTTIIYLGCVRLFWAKISWFFCPGRHFLAKITAFPLKGQSQRSR